MSYRAFVRPQTLSWSALAVALVTGVAFAAPTPAQAPTPIGANVIPKSGATLGGSGLRTPARLSPQRLVIDATTYVEVFSVNAFKPKDGVMTFKPSIGAPASGTPATPGGFPPPGVFTPPAVFIPSGAVDLYFSSALGARYRVECQVAGPGRFIFAQPGSRSGVVEASGGRVSFTLQDLPAGPGKKVTLYGQSPDATMTREWTWSGCDISQ